jgi:hypothetical protein
VLARFLSPPERRPVLDRTGLTGYFDADLEASAEFGPPSPPPGVAERASVKVFVIDPVEHPTENEKHSLG